MTEANRPAQDSSTGSGRLRALARLNGGFLGRITGDVLRISGAVGLGQILAFAAAPLLTRLYGPEAFGHFAILGAFTNILLPIVLLRLNWALPLPQREEDAREILALSLLTVAVLAPLLGLAGSALQPVLARWLDITLADIWLLAVALAVTALYEILLSWLVRQRAFAQVAGARFLSLVGVVGCQTLFALVQPDASSLLLGYIGGYFLGFARAAWPSREALLDALRGARLHRLRAVAAEYRRFPLVATPSSIVSAVSAQVPSLVLPSLYGLAMTGQWSLAQRVLWQPAAFVGQAVNQVFWGNAARLQHEDPKRLWLMFVVLNAGLLAMMAPGLVLVWWGGDLFALLFGPAWTEAGQFAGILVLSSVVGIAAHGTESLHIYGLNHWMAAWEVMRLAFIGAALTASWWFGLPALGCVAALTVAHVVANLSLFVLNALAIWRIRARTLPAGRPAAVHH